MELNNDFRYCVEYDYSTSYSCEESGCDSEGICRCGVIENARVVSVSMRDLVNNIYDNLMPNDLSRKRNQKISSILGVDEQELDKYCINRILTHLKVYDPDNWEVETEGGYYGEEIGEVLLSDYSFNELKTHCQYMFLLGTIEDKLRYVLSLEYGYAIEFSKVELDIIDRNKILFKDQNQNHIGIVKNKKERPGRISETPLYYSSKNYDLPRGIVRKMQGGYKIVDGFHRILFSEDDNLIVFIIE